MSGPSDRTLPFGKSCADYLSGTVPDTCPSLPGEDPFFNYMNYLDKNLCFELRGEFTCNQVERMFKEWLLFRDRVSSCEDPTTHGELELIFSVDEDYLRDIFDIILVTEDNQIIFDTYNDHLFSFAIFQDVYTMEVDLCLPRDQLYQLYVTNYNGNSKILTVKLPSQR